MQKVNGKFIVRIETCVDCGDEFMIDLEEFIQKTESDAKEIRMLAGFRHWEDIQQLKVIVIVYMAADNERKVSNNGIF